MKKIFPFFLIFFIIGLLGLTIYNQFRIKKYQITLTAFHSNVIIKYNTKDAFLAKKVDQTIQEIYKKYDQLTDTTKEYEGIYNLYYIRHNFSKEEYLTLDKDLYNLLSYGIDLYEKTNEKVDISLGNVTNLWNSYLENKNGIPTRQELKIVHNQTIKNIVLKENNKILNNHVNIDVSMIIRSYVANIIKEYFESNKISYYSIHTTNSITLGSPYQKEYFSVALQDPNTENDIFKVIKEKNKAISTKGIFEKCYEYQNQRYHNIIDSSTLFPANYMKSVTVITEDIKEADMLSAMLFLMSVEDGMQYIETLENTEAIWYQNDNTITYSSGLKDIFTKNT